MNTKMKMLEAAVLHLRSKALAELAALEVLLDNPAGVPEQTDYVSQIVEHSLRLSDYEQAMLAVQKYFLPEDVQQPQPVPQPAPQPPVASPPRMAPEAPPSGESAPITAEELAKRSGTYRRSQGISLQDAFEQDE